MKKDIAKKWVKALRSGKYKQGEGFLKEYNKKNQARYCCLGVLCELYNESMKKNHKKSLKITTREHTDYGTEGNGYVVFNNQGQSLPSAVKKWAGIKDETGEFVYQQEDRYGRFGEYQNLSMLNDTGHKFSTIADIIEKNVENL
jgi:hypothetical protein